MTISICIPTYNRSKHLSNCINSIISCKNKNNLNFELCISNNNSSDDTDNVIALAKKQIKFKYNKNKTNIGMTKNFIKVVSMASSDFIWLIGDDDLILPNSIDKILTLIKDNPDVDFFYVNSFHLSTQYVEKFPTPFDINNLPKNMVSFSKYKKEGLMPFFDLINPKISFDFLGGMFLYVFRKDNWDKNISSISKFALEDKKQFSHFDNTFPHLKIISRSFSNSTAYFHPSPLGVNLSGVREWSPMSPLVMSVRLPEALDEYRKNGLPFFQYHYCKNFSLNNFFSDYIKLVFYKNISGGIHTNTFTLLLKNIFYPNLYLSFFYFFFRKFGNILKSTFYRLKFWK